jgi:2,4-dienoyl-CoA reductase-like NADH-dependent reductase (Old Yellow Enzyme family)
MKLSESLELPCGKTLPNRIGKSAMSENMASEDHIPGPEFPKAYETWVKGGTGLIITGNVMVDSRHRGEPNNVVIEQGRDNLQQLKQWAAVSKESNSHIWVQLNHPGKQTPKYLTPEPVGPSSIPLSPPLDAMFNQCRELTHEEVLEIIQRFGYAAQICKEAGFDGVQIHGAHGYLVSQFLSPRHNQRDDHWGGTPEKRMNFVLEVYQAMRKEVGKEFPIGIKINSADFTKGGFTPEEAIEVAKKLSESGIDLIELSGGSYEKPAMTGVKVKESTAKREAYFLEYAQAIKEVISCPIMVTGGFRTRDFMEKSLEENKLDIVGLARPLCLNPNMPNQLLNGEDVKSQVRQLTSGVKAIDKVFPLEIIWYTMQIHRLGRGLKPKPKAGVYGTIFKSAFEVGLQSLKRNRM